MYKLKVVHTINFLIVVTSHHVDPPPCHKLSTLRLTPPLERDVIYGRPFFESRAVQSSFPNELNFNWYYVTFLLGSVDETESDAGWIEGVAILMRQWLSLFLWRLSTIWRKEKHVPCDCKTKSSSEHKFATIRCGRFSRFRSENILVGDNLPS